MKKFILIFMVFILSSCSLFEEEATPPAPKQSQTNIDPIPIKDNEEATIYAYHKLSKDEQILYQNILEGITQYDKKIELENCNKDLFNKIYDYIFSDHPEIFYLNKKYKYYIDEDNMILYPQYRMDETKKDKIQKQIDQVTAPLVKKASKLKTDLDKMKYYFDYIVDHCDYVKGSKDNQEITSVFLYKKSVCSGYGKALQYLCHLSDIDMISLSVIYKSDKSRHLINAMQLDGKYYYSDITNADQNIIAKNTRYHYMLLDEKYINDTFNFDRLELKIHTKNMKNYFEMHNLSFKEYNTKQINDMIKYYRKQKSNEIVFECKNQSIATQIHQYIFYECDVKDIVADASTLHYLKNKDIYYLTN